MVNGSCVLDAQFAGHRQTPIDSTPVSIVKDRHLPFTRESVRWFVICLASLFRAGKIARMAKRRRFKDGDVVKTRDNQGPEMCVIGYSEEDLVKCLWWRELKTVTQEFSEAHLMAVSNIAGIGDEIMRRAKNFVDTVGKKHGETKDGKE